MSSAPTPQDVQLITTKRAAELLACSTRTVYRLVERGELTYVGVGRHVRIELSEIARYIERNRLHRADAPEIQLSEFDRRLNHFQAATASRTNA